MFTRVRRWIGSLNRSDHADEGGQRVENSDAAAAATHVIGTGGNNIPVGGGMPSDYVKSYDEGRPPH